MKNLAKNLMIVAIALIVIMTTSGCTNWKKKYQALNTEYQNMRGLLAHERSEKGQLASQISESQMTIEQLQQQIAEQQSPAQATGFGDEYDVSFDANAGTVTVTLPNAILFKAGKATLKQTRSAELNHIVSVCQEQYAGKEIDVVGHTDSDPIKKSKWKDNWELSSQRSLSVVRYMIAQGISKDAIRAVGRGETKPVTSNATSSGKARNRRVEIVVHMK